jgi:hypothetical protein
MQINIECPADRGTHVSVHRLEPKMVDLSSEHGPLYVLHHAGDPAHVALSVFFYDKQLMELRRQIDEILESKRARVSLAGIAAAPTAPEAGSA